MSTIDDRVVSIKFDNREFEQNISATLASIDSLNTKLTTLGLQNGLGNVQAAAQSVDLAPLESSVSNISSKFTTLGAVGFSAINNITNSAMSFAKNFISKDILEPLITGGKTRAGNIEQAKFQLKGLGVDSSEISKNALTAVKGTAYGLGDSFKAAAQFAASGISAGEDMTTSLRAISGMAAVTGTSYADMAYLFTTSAATGRITNMDLQQFATRGMNAAAAYAKATGTTEVAVHQMATNGTLDYKTFAKVMDDTFGAHATEANQTYSGSLANMHAAMSRIGESFFSHEQRQQRDLFNALSPIIDEVNHRLQPLLKTFLNFRNEINKGTIGALNNLRGYLTKKSLFGSIAIPNFAEAMRNAFSGVEKLFKVVRKSFRDIFPPNLLLNILSISESIRSFSEHLKMGAETAHKVRRIFDGLFSVISIGWAIIKGIATAVKEMITAFKPAGSGFLNAAAGAGDLLTKLKVFLVDGGKIQGFFVKLGEVLSKPIYYISVLTTKIEDFIQKIARAAGTNITNKFNDVSTAADKVGSTWDKLMAKMHGVLNVLDSIWQAISDWFSQLGGKLANALKPGDFDSVIQVMNFALLGGIAKMLAMFFSGGLNVEFGGLLVNKIKTTLTQLKNSLNMLQTQIKAQAIMRIAEAVALMAASMFLLSLIDGRKLANALLAMAVGMGELIAVMMAMDKGISGSIKFPIIAASLTAMAFALVIFAAAVKLMASISAGDMAKGLIGIGVSLGILIVATKTISKNPAGLIATGISMIEMSIGLLILSKAVKSFGKIKTDEMKKGLIGISIALAAIALAMLLMPPSSIFAGAGIIETAIGLGLLAIVVKQFGKMKWEELKKGLFSITVLLGGLALAMMLMPPTAPLIAAGLILVSYALDNMVGTVKKFGSMNWKTLLIGLGGIAALLLILAVSLAAMNGSIIGAAALIIAAGALFILADVLEKIGKLSIAQLITSLIAIAATFALLGIAALLLSPVLPEMLALGIVLAIIGAAFTLFGIGAALVGVAIASLSISFPIFIKALITSTNDIIKALPNFVTLIILSIVQIVVDLAKAIPMILRVLEALIIQLLETIIKLAPEIGKTVVALILMLTKAIQKTFPSLVATGYLMLLTILKGFRDHIKEIVTLGVDILVRFIKALTDNLPKLVTAVVTLITTFINALSDHIGDIVTAGANLIISFIEGISNNIQRIINKGVHVIEKFLSGVSSKDADLLKAGVNFVISIAKGITNSGVDFVKKGTKVVTNFIGGMLSAINDKTGKNTIVSKFADLAIGIINGLKKAIDDKGPQVTDAIHSLFWSLIKAGVDIFNINSPSKVFMGQGSSIVEGLALGISNNSMAVNSASNMADNVVNAFNNTLNTIPDSLSNMGEFNPVITPILDLTRVQAASGAIADYMAVSSISPNVSTKQAHVISSIGNVGKSMSSSVATGSTTLKFEQTINAPKALSTNDIYRNTRSQIALAKEEFSIL